MSYLPPPPEWFDADHLAVWHATVFELRSMELERSTDWQALVSYVETVILDRRLARDVGGLAELVVVNSVGTMSAHPLLAALGRAQMRHLAFARQFGLTPYSRGELTKRWPDSEADRDSMEAFFRDH